MTRRAVLVATGVVVLQALLVALFAWPAANAEPRDLPIVVAGPAPAAERFAGQLRAERPGAFDITTVDSEAAADQALRDRDGYAAFVVRPGGMVLHTASAASPAVAQLLTQMAGEQQVQVTDVVPTDQDDPRGGGFGLGFLPLGLTALLVGIALVLTATTIAARLAGLLAYAVLAGLIGALVLQEWLGILPDQYLASALALGLFALAAGATVTGLGSALGYPGIGLGALVVFLVANPLSAVNLAPELLPQPWGEVGQWLPVGAAGTALRSAAYFDWAGSAHAVWVLAGYAVVGLVLVALGRRPAVTTA